MRKTWWAAAIVFAVSTAAHASAIQLSGKMYSDFSYRQNVDEGANKTSSDSGTAFDFKRFYAGIAYQLDDRFSAHFVTDIGDHGTKRYDVFVKNAYLEAKLAPQLILRAGAANNPWIPWAEDRYGFRFVENTLIDRTHFGSSADWGLHVLGDFAGGKVGYQVSLVNGRGYSDPARAQAPSVEARVNAKLFGHLFLALGGAATQFGANVVGKSTPNMGTRVDALAAWDAKRFRVGAEAFLAHDFTTAEVTGKTPEDSARGLSTFANYQFLPQYGVFGRFDYVQPNAVTNSGLTDSYFDGGLEATPFKSLTLALVYKHEVVQAGAAEAKPFVTENGSIGSTVPGQSGQFQELGLFSQVAF